MKNKLIWLLSGMILVILIGTLIISLNNKDREKAVEGRDEGTIKIVSSFYPTYVILLNLMDDIPGFELKSLVDYNTGCLHDYQLTTENMVDISSAHIFVMNGGGMESYMEDVIQNYPSLYLINSSEGITMFEEEHEDEDREDEDQGKDRSDIEVEEFNAHVWLDPQNYIIQIVNIKNGLIQYISQNEGFTEAIKLNMIDNVNTNAIAYMDRVKGLDQTITDKLETLVSNYKESGKSNEVVIFHDAFAYLANRIGLEVIYTVEMDDDTSLSAGDIAEIIQTIKTNQVQYLFTEQQYKDTIATRIEAETNAKVYIINSAVTGNGSKDSYIDAMNYNINILREAFQ